MDHEIGTRGRRHRGDFRKRPCHRIVAVLGRIARRQPAAGVAEYQDALRVRPRQRQRLAVHDRSYRTRRHRGLAAPHREDGGFDILELLVRRRAHRHGRRLRRRTARTDRHRPRSPGRSTRRRGRVRPIATAPGLRTSDRKQAQNSNGDRGVSPVAALDLHGRPFTLDFQAKRMSAPNDDGSIMYPAAMTVERPAFAVPVLPLRSRHPWHFSCLDGWRRVAPIAGARSGIARRIRPFAWI